MRCLLSFSLEQRLRYQQLIWKGGTSHCCPRKCCLSQGSNRHSWYIGAYYRCEAETALYRMSVDGAFLVRDCSKKIADEPYVLVVFYENKVYNVKIRYLEQSQQYALGTGLWGNDTFDSISDIIEFHKIYPIILIDGKDKSGTQKEQCTLTYPVTENDIKNL